MTENKKLPIIVTGVVLGLIVLTAIFQDKPSGKLSQAAQAVPANAGIIFETADLGLLIHDINTNKAIIGEMEKSNALSEISDEINYISKLAESNSDIERFIDGREFVISVHQSHKYESAKLYVSPIRKKDFDKFEEAVREQFKETENIKIVYEDAEIFKVIFSKENNYNFNFCFYNDLLLFSFSDVLIQKSIRALKTTASIAEKENYKKIHKLTGKSKHRIFFNYSRLPETIFKYIAGNKETTEFIRSFADISGFEIEITDNKLQLDGYTISNEKSKYISIFKTQAPGKHRLLKSLPYYTSSFILMNIGSGSEFRGNYDSYLASHNKLQGNKKSINTWYKTHTADKRSNFFDCIGGEMALISYAKNSREDNRKILLTEISDRQNSIDFLKSVAKKHEYEPSGHIANNKNYIIFPFPGDNFFSLNFGTLFDHFSAKTACLTEDYFIFAESDSLMKEFLNDFDGTSTMAENEFIQTLNSESNIFIYTNLYKSFPLLKNYTASASQEHFNTDADFWRKITGPGIQFLADSDPIYTTLKLELSSRNKGNLQTEWETTLDSPPITKPFVVKNHDTGANEILIQTQSNTIYLINDKGNVLWKKIIDGRIISEVHQIDYYQNGKLQLLFNTKKSLYLIDRIGNNTADYPITFKHEATNGIAVFDYNKTRDYRIFFAAENKGVYALDKTGNTLNGWVFGKTTGRVSQSVQYFQYDKKDYICFFDENKLYITNRKGEIRIKPIADFPIASKTEIFFEEKTETSLPRFALTDPTGYVYFVYLDGTVKRLQTDEFSDKHYFMYADIVGDSYPEFIFADNKTVSVFDRNKSEVFSVQTDDIITDRLYLYRFSDKNKQLGVINGNADKVYLIKGSGSIENGFPIKGNTPFSIRIFGENEHFSLIAGNSSVKLISYRLYQ